MNFTQAALAAIVIFAPTIGLAQGFEGAELSAGILAYSDDTDLGETNYHGGLEFGITPLIGVGADFHYNGFRGRDENSTGFTLHGLYGLNDTATLGLFFGQDRRDDGTTDVYGIEGAAFLPGAEVQGYLGQFDGWMGAGTMIGVDGSFAFTDSIAAIGSAGVVNFDEAESTSRLSLGGEYRFAGGPAVFAELGRIDDGTGNENFLAIGGRIELGQGTTFGPRGIAGIIPGF